tara:strand:- start:276 stop:512 length:237 start_codon:yes stop_codon:yes gene_type:complete
MISSTKGANCTPRRIERHIAMHSYLVSSFQTKNADIFDGFVRNINRIETKKLERRIERQINTKKWKQYVSQIQEITNW